MAWKSQSNKVESVLNKKKDEQQKPYTENDLSSSDSEGEENDEYTEEDFEAMKKEIEFLEEKQHSQSLVDVLKTARERGYIGTHHTEIVGKYNGEVNESLEA